jgi:hypothetical protein
MYVALRKMRLSGCWVEPGSVLPAHYQPPAHLVQSGHVVRLPDELVYLDELKSDKPDEEPEVIEPVNEEVDEPMEPEMIEASEEVDDEPDEPELDDALAEEVKQYHSGGATYVIDGEKIRGKQNAMRKLLEIKG